MTMPELILVAIVSAVVLVLPKSRTIGDGLGSIAERIVRLFRRPAPPQAK